MIVIISKGFSNLLTRIDLNVRNISKVSRVLISLKEILVNIFKHIRIKSSLVKSFLLISFNEKIEKRKSKSIRKSGKLTIGLI